MTQQWSHDWSDVACFIAIAVGVFALHSVAPRNRERPFLERRWPILTSFLDRCVDGPRFLLALCPVAVCLADYLFHS